MIVCLLLGFQFLILDIYICVCVGSTFSFGVLGVLWFYFLVSTFNIFFLGLGMLHQGC